jgi:hypothetical protein
MMKNYGCMKMKKLLGNNEILVLDNLLSNEEIKKIEENFIDNKFPWFVSGIEDYTSPDENNKFRDENTFEYGQFCHHFVLNEKINSDWIEVIHPTIDKLQKHFNCYLKFKRIKANLQTKIETNLLYNTPHTDDEISHYVVIYYVNDSDGKTFIFKNKRKPWKIEKIVESKAGRFVIFDGKKVHAGAHPKSNRRMVINYTIVETEEITDM